MTSRAAFAYAEGMIRQCRRFVLLLGVMSAGAVAVAQAKDEPAAQTAPAPAAPAAPKAEADEKTEAAPAPAGPTLSSEEILTATKIDSFTIPTPGEILAAIDKLGTPDWESALRPPAPNIGLTRPQMALNIGGLIADGYLAVEAENAQQVKNIGKDIMSLARPLGVQQEILNRGKSLTDFAQQGQWSTLKEELEATQNEVKAAMTENKDSSLITLVTLGGWIRSIQAMSDYVDKHYSPEGARLLRQPAVAHFLGEQLSALPEKIRDDSAVRKARNGLVAIEKAVSFPVGEPPDAAAVKELSKLTQELLTDIAKKK
jgi:hypothetical protein